LKLNVYACDMMY